MTYQELLEQSVQLLDTDVDEALKGFNYLLTEKPESTPLLFYVGTGEMKRGNYGLAQKVLEKVLDSEDDSIEKEAWNNLGYLYHQQGKLQKADRCFSKALEIDPDSADLINNQATMYVNNGTPDEAINRCNRGLNLDPEHPHLLWNKGLAYLEKGKWKEGWELYSRGIETGHRRTRSYSSEGVPVWNKEPGTVVVYGEQGIGDEVMFASILEDAQKDANIIFECHPRLVNIFKNSFDMPIYGTRKDDEIAWPKYHDIDYAIPIGSLGGLYRNSNRDFPRKPYIKADEYLVDKCKARFTTNKPKVVIHWKGGTAKTNKDYRSVPLLDWEPILKQDCEFISLQYTDNAKEIAREVAEKYGVTIHHWQDVVDDMDWQTAMLEAADLVISVCTSIVHISGALGKECWCLTPKQVAWRYGIKGKKMPWYDSVKLYRQQEAGKWDAVLSQVVKDMKEKLHC